MRKILVRLGITFAVVLLLLAGAAGTVLWQLHASLPRLDGTVALPGFQNPVRITRDALGVPDILASNRVDASRALGFVHAQERFFQMDLLRRRGAGELAALFGPPLVEHDQATRRHQLRLAARATVDRLSPFHRDVLNAYTEGVNAGLNDLGARPPEYLLLRKKPEPWRAEDALLVGYAMFFTLQDTDGNDETTRLALQEALPKAVFDFFFPDGSDWDAPIDDSKIPAAPLPGPDVFDLISKPKPTALRIPVADGDGSAEFTRHPTRCLGPDKLSSVGGDSENGIPAGREPELVPGSNSWGVDGQSSTTGSAIVANDMHLDLGMPNIWFRVSLRWHLEDNRMRRMVGVSLPGVPFLIIGSNGDIAWGFTNATIDTTDRVILELDPADPSRYRTPEGWKTLETVHETIEVSGESPHSFTFQKSIWGPVLSSRDPRIQHAAQWIGHAPDAINLGLVDLESAGSTAEALDLAPGCHVPMQNFLVGDSKGNLGWTLIGLVPKRVGFEGRIPTSWADGTRRWEPSAASDQRPRFLATPGQRLWTANNRIVGTDHYMELGGALTDGGARARQIRDDLRALPAKTDEAGLLSIHRDDRALFLERWQRLVLDLLAQPGDRTNALEWAQARAAVSTWGGHAAIDSVGYRLVRGFRLRALEGIYAPILAHSGLDPSRISVDGARSEHAFWTLVEAKPRHLLDPKFLTYDALLGSALDQVLTDLKRQGIPLEQATWGSRNRSRIQHPISRAVPKLAPYLDMVSIPLPGDDHMPRVQGPGFGASERFVVSPGHEERGIFHMPGGQSGHFLSAYYRAGHEAWVNVEPTPLLPGPTQHTLVLQPN